MRFTYSNIVSAPEHVLTGTIGRRSYLVIPRLVLPGGDEVWVPVRVVRWTAQAVMICLEPDQDQAPEYSGYRSTMSAAPSPPPRPPSTTVRASPRLRSGLDD